MISYPVIRTFFDADSIACVFTSDILSAYPQIEKFTTSYQVGDKFHERNFHSFTWDIGGTIVMAVGDVQEFIRIYTDTLKRIKNENENNVDGTPILSFDDCDLSMICRCGVCDELLFPDDEAYTDEISGKVLCDHHSATNEATGNYVESPMPMDRVEAIIVNVLIEFESKTQFSNYVEFKSKHHKLLLFTDKDIWEMEVEEFHEISRGQLNVADKDTTYYILYRNIVLYLY
jgi:hypothetical protein